MKLNAIKVTTCRLMREYGYTYQDIADTLNISVTTAWTLEHVGYNIENYRVYTAVKRQVRLAKLNPVKKKGWISQVWSKRRAIQ